MKPSVQSLSASILRLRWSWGLLFVFVSFCLLFLSFEAKNAQNEQTVILQIERDLLILERLLIDRETGQRGYVISGDTEFLAPYLTAGDTLKTLLPELSI